MLIDPDAFEACFSAWAQSFAEAFDREVVAINGKSLRRSFDRGRAQGPLHLVSAWASEQGLAGATHEGFDPLHRNLEEQSDGDPELGFPGRKCVIDIRIFLELGPSWFHASPLSSEG